MAKEQPEPPKPGERVRLRGRAATGVLRMVNPQTSWASVIWDNGAAAGPKIVHLKELETYREESS